MVNERISGRRRGLARRAGDWALAVVVLALVALLVARLDAVDRRFLSGDATVSDGDSLEIAGIRVRLRGIDAPELDQRCVRDGEEYRCGEEARDVLAALADRGPVECRGWEYDRFGRLLAHCMAGETDLNRAMVERGWAVAYGDYGAEEATARETRTGLWSGSFEPPQSWRASRGTVVGSAHDAGNMALNWLRQMFGFDREARGDGET